MIVIGISLVVYPFASLIEFVNETCPRMLINREPANVYKEVVAVENVQLVDISPDKGLRFKFGHLTNRRDVFAGGDCQAAVYEFAKHLDLESELLALLPEDIQTQVISGSYFNTTS